MLKKLQSYYKAHFNWRTPVGFTNTVEDQKSPSWMAHRFAHELHNSSVDLNNYDQSGALREHFADLQGVSFEADYKNKGIFDYSLGDEILSPEDKSLKRKLANLSLSKTSKDEAKHFALNQPALKNLYKPEFSYGAQLTDLKEVQKIYGTSCEPNIRNDYCGVHASTGVLNKAAALSIAQFGFQKTKKLFFNTLMHRLNANANFSDYLRQVYEECREDSKIFTLEDCNTLANKFMAQGVVAPSEDKLILNKRKKKKQPYSLTNRFDSLDVELCGFSFKNQAGDLTLVDNKFDAMILNSPKSYPGYKTRLSSKLKKNKKAMNLADHSCACVKGRLAQIPKQKSESVKYMRSLSSIEEKNFEHCEIEGL